ncbi:MAG: pilus assembly PilX N-terminal domain-containing protein [Deltaproteobacteria bacterium]|nr:pilus assembly PilX N-terminal domain-containing protein [Deltaproteobacteria bacterium]
MKPKYTDDRGFALASVLLLFALLATMGAGAMMYTTLESKSTNHYNTGNQAMYAAEAGILDAVNSMNMSGVTNFDLDVTQRWSSLFSPATQSLPGYSQFTYTVTVASDATQPADKGTITSTGKAPYSAQRVIRVGVRRGTIGKGMGAIYLAADSVSTQFSGNAFWVDGNDHDQNGAIVAGGDVEPGIATRNDTVTSGVKSSLNAQQEDNVQGLGFSLSPLNPSVVTTGGPSVSDLNNIISNILADPRVQVNNVSDINGNQTFGTTSSPQITHMTANNVKIHANGNASGAGILIVDGSITINGGFDFVGWIIVRGNTTINDGTETDFLGNASIYGSLWTGDMTVKVGGSAVGDYCSWCLNLVVPPNGGGYMPKAMSLTSWQEIL